MKINILIMLIVCFHTININAQDIIIKKTGDEIQAKITEVGLENIKYKKFDNINGPTYTMPKYEIFMIKYENGTKDVFKEEIQNSKKNNQVKNIDYKRKGFYLGFHLTPGTGAILIDTYKFGFAINSGADLNIYFNDYVGIKTGFSYINLPIKYGNELNYFGSVTGNISSIGIPIKFLLTTGNRIGFYMESGLNIYFPISSHIEDNYYYLNDSHESIILAEESVFGINIKTSELISLNLGLGFHYSLTKNFENENSKGFLIGLQIGMLFKLNKNY